MSPVKLREERHSLTAKGSKVYVSLYNASGQIKNAPNEVLSRASGSHGPDRSKLCNEATRKHLPPSEKRTGLSQEPAKRPHTFGRLHVTRCGLKNLRGHFKNYF